MQYLAAFFREHAENVATKPLQPSLPSAGSYLPIEQKNPGSAATETGIKSTVKASSVLLYFTPNLDVEATSNRGRKLLPGGAS
ncbi:MULTISPECIES: hypothetical protein [unclassified Paracoccus (in: a-proteobacteria)]|uniref:hypothetical protein n=1 Tax=unclassified Paracoccus (in: a-proteobacteria) TaxID=2688777 RepID=UPI001ADA9140|nr:MULTISPECIES: hypothetical protein [unclassified Paracoccus (in: a-proteobacteria)]MBO9455115.1 hypothetical protein [Paracoccus sp. R12_2]